MIERKTILQLCGVLTAGILLFDLWLKLTGNPTISNSIIVLGASFPLLGIGICAAICILILHIWSNWL